MKKKYLKRSIDNALLAWSRQTEHKPLLLRGARQVGKSSSVEELARHFEFFIKVDFEKEKEVHAFFSSDLSPEKICDKLSIFYDIPVIPRKTLLFLDEIQSCPAAIASLRYFYEDFPELHVVAAGSLLEFALESLPSFGVGRIRSLFMYPFSFAEFLYACGEERLWNEICEASSSKSLLVPFHNKANEYLRQFLALGGMPAVISAFVRNRDLRECMYAIDDLTVTLKSDFSKYKKRVPDLRITTVFESVVRQTGGSFSYSKIAQEYNYRQLKESLMLLQQAGWVIPVIHTAATGIPLGAQVNLQKQKMLLLDTGIFQRLLGLSLNETIFSDEISLINKGAIAELFVGLELLKATESHIAPQLFFWQREAAGSSAEVDYVIQQGNNIIPIEVKAGTKGAMQSMRLFIKEKNSIYGIRTSLENFAQYDNIQVVPMYAIGNIAQK